jgi:Fic family protein
MVVVKSSEIEGKNSTPGRSAPPSRDVLAWISALSSLRTAMSQEALSAVPAKARFWERIKDVHMNKRQRLLINRLRDRFKGKLTSSKYALLARSSQDTAYRDILALVHHGVLVQNPEGGSAVNKSMQDRARSPGTEV